MIVCPVCENPQAQGTVCDVCGRELAAAAKVDVPIVKLPDLEGTLVEGGRAPVVVAPIADLEATRSEAVGAVQTVALQELERTAAEAVGAVQVAALSDLDQTRYVDTDARTAVPTGAVTCRYCKNVQAQGAICDRCGMKLPKVSATPQAASAEGQVTCTDCGTPGAPGRPCRACGARIPAGA
jgi:ribosomal protein L32